MVLIEWTSGISRCCSTAVLLQCLVEDVEVLAKRSFPQSLRLGRGVCNPRQLACRAGAWIYSSLWMLVIVNPRSGRGAGSRSLLPLRRELHERDIEARIALTTGPGHATELARAAVESRERCVVAVGGDGTVSEIANSLVESPVALGVVAVGTGNDLARSLNLPLNDVPRSLDVIQEGGTHQIDLGRAGDRYFVSLFGLGFPAIVAAYANRMRLLTGTSAFLLSVLRRILQMQAVPLKLKIDGRIVEGKYTSVLIQNTPFTGGGLKIAPTARVDDGQLDVVIVGDIGKLDLLWNLPRVYRGRHLGHRHFKTYRCNSVQIQSEKVLAQTLDGDPFDLNAVKVEVHPGALRMIVRPPGARKHD